ncbi:MAG: sigma-70 family RNA polymerase sigma factor [Fibrobacterales bacterium]
MPSPSDVVKGFVDTYGDILFNFARSRVSQIDVAEDLVQETYIAALKGWEKFSGNSSEKTWLIGILKHKIYDHYKKSKREVPESHLQKNSENDGIMDYFFGDNGYWKMSPGYMNETPESEMNDKQLAKWIKDCITKLPEKFRIPFILKEIDEMDSDIVCKDCEITATNLWVILHRSRLQLRECLSTVWNKEGV